MDALKKKLLGAKDPKDEKAAEGKKDEKAAEDNTDELGLRTKTGERLYRIYKLVEAKKPGQQAQAEPVEVVIGVSNSKFTEVVKGPLQAGDKVVVRSLLADPTKQP
jgi:multidrug efflux pump subunit AcrA (membrane-fusion protein)